MIAAEHVGQRLGWRAATPLFSTPVGVTHQVLHDPRHPYTKGLLAASRGGGARTAA